MGWVEGEIPLSLDFGIRGIWNVPQPGGGHWRPRLLCRELGVKGDTFERLFTLFGQSQTVA